ncbi:MAG TPA: DMT family transporter [Deltaproteobacteria bacterium]|nr:DMT family transporter [Deltaproteobacteria bacterium]HOM29977.1 DMT family transporter [Deltaproteobacteria bacterium]
MERQTSTGRTFTSDLLLLTTAAIWGLAFVAQRAGMEHVGPFGFNGVRFMLGAMVLLPLLARRSASRREQGQGEDPRWRVPVGGGLAAGLVLFAGASFQQVAMVYTQAANAGFITGLYVVIVPVIGILIGHRTNAGTWVGAVLAAVGMYLLSVSGPLEFAYGDMLVLVGAVFWACHVHIIGYLSPKTDALAVSFIQYTVCACLSLAVSFLLEANTLDGYLGAAVPILYGGVMSVGVAYTLQVVAQKKAKPSHAAVILCLEAVFAALGGWVLLGETLTGKGLAGCALMFAGMLSSQLMNAAEDKGA